MNTGQSKATVTDLPQHSLVVGNAAAGAAKGIGRADNHRIANAACKGKGGLHVMNHGGGDARLMNGLHGVLKALSILRLVNGIGGGSQQTHTVLVQRAVLIKIHGKVQAHLPSQRWQHGVRPLLFDDLLQGEHIQWFNVDVVGDVLVGHDGGGVGIDQNHLHALLLQGAAGLRARIVKLSGLPNDNGPGADDQNLFNACILRHPQHSPFL